MFRAMDIKSGGNLADRNKQRLTLVTKTFITFKYQKRRKKCCSNYNDLGMNILEYSFYNLWYQIYGKEVIYQLKAINCQNT